MSAPSVDQELVERTTALALEEKTKLVKSLRRVDMFLFTVCAFVGLDTLGTVASNGPLAARVSDTSVECQRVLICCAPSATKRSTEMAAMLLDRVGRSARPRSPERAIDDRFNVLVHH